MKENNELGQYLCEWFEMGKQKDHCIHSNGTQCMHCYEIMPWPQARPSPTEEKRNEGMKVYEWDEVFKEYSKLPTHKSNSDLIAWFKAQGYKLIQPSPSPDKPEH